MSVRGYNIANVSSNLNLDLYGGGSANGTKVVVYNLNQQPSGTANQQWRATQVSPGVYLFVIQNVLTGTYASIDGNASSGQGVVGNATPTVWEITPVSNTSPSFIIKVPYANLVWTQSSGQSLSQITLATQGSGNNTQQWDFKNVVY